MRSWRRGLEPQSRNVIDLRKVYLMNRLLATLVILIASGLLVGQSFGWGSNNSRAQGLVVTLVGEVERIRGEHVFEAIEGGALRRGEIVKTGESWAVIEFGGARIALAHTTEIQLTAPGIVKLIGGRILTSDPITITTPWIDVRSETPVSVVNYAWKGEVDIIPIEEARHVDLKDLYVASTIVDNETLGTLPVSLPSSWVESEQDLITSLEPFNVETSSEAEFYAWATKRIKEVISPDDEIE